MRKYRAGDHKVLGVHVFKLVAACMDGVCKWIGAECQEDVVESSLESCCQNEILLWRIVAVGSLRYGSSAIRTIVEFDVGL